MPRTIEIAMTQEGSEVRAGDHVAAFQRLDETLGFAGEHLGRAAQIREMKARID